MAEDLDKVGRWEGSKFVFDPPLRITTAQGSDLTVESVDRNHMNLPHGMTDEDFIRNLLLSRKDASREQD